MRIEDKIKQIKLDCAQGKSANYSLFQINTGSYIYIAKAVIINGILHYQIIKTDQFNTYIASSEVRVSPYGIEYNNQGGTLRIPASVSKKLVQEYGKCL